MKWAGRTSLEAFWVFSTAKTQLKFAAANAETERLKQNDYTLAYNKTGKVALFVAPKASGTQACWVCCRFGLPRISNGPHYDETSTNVKYCA